MNLKIIQNICEKTAKYNVFSWFLVCKRDCVNDWPLLGRFYDIEGPFGDIDVKQIFENRIREEINDNSS